MKSGYESSNRSTSSGARIAFRLLSFFLLSSLLLSSCIPQPDLMPTHTPTSLPAPTPIVNTRTGDLLDQVYQLEDFMPLAKSGGYVLPTKEERASYSEIISSLEAGDLVNASGLARGHGYALLRYLDLGDKEKVSYLLQEGIPVSKGWGLYLIREEAANNIIVEAPHPLSDKQSELIALDIYRALDARALLIAGAHRDANDDAKADVAHTKYSIFQSVHETLLRKTPVFSDVPVVLQIHGFTAKKRPGYPNIILGFGKKASWAEIALAKEIVGALASRGLEAGYCVDDSWPDLCAKKNVQGSSKGEAVFIHIELDETARSDSNSLVAALAEVVVNQNPTTP
jgi:hypothetical protein